MVTEGVNRTSDRNESDERVWSGAATLIDSFCPVAAGHKNEIRLTKLQQSEWQRLVEEEKARGGGGVLRSMSHKNHVTNE
jgi:hypothetical protein